MATTVQNFYGLKTPRPKGGKKKTNSELIGIEIELEHVKIHGHTAPWITKEDHSLKKNGLEFTLLTYHNYAEESIAKLLTNIKSKATSRCGIHVHINALDMTLNEIKVMLMYYMVFERALYAYSGKRWKNIFCVPMREWCVSLDYDNLLVMGHLWQKYSGLNLLTLKQFGTIEFRQMIGTTNPSYIQGWIEMIVALKKASRGKNPLEVAEEIGMMNSTSGYWHLMKTIFGNLAYALQYPTLKDDLEDCIAHTKLCYLTPINFQGT